MPKKLTTEEFIEKAKDKHGDKYDYSKVEYVQSKQPVCIICPEHGEFWQKPNAHLNGQSCPKCGNIERIKTKTYTQEEFIEKAREIHGDKYDYSKVEYNGCYTKVCIICPIHGEFYQTPSAHLQGNGCKKCADKEHGLNRRKTVNNFVDESIKIHGDKYDYSKVEYINAQTKVNIICPIHGEFSVRPCDHLTHSSGCPKCGFLISKAEDEIIQFINNNLLIGTINRNRHIIPPLELDIYIPEKQIAIEYNGVLWHSEKYNKDKNYHIDKLNKCNCEGIKLIHIFEDEWLEHKEIVLSKIKHILKRDNDLLKIQARKCIVKEIDKEETKSFLEKNHIQGYVPSTVHLACFYDNDLVGVMTFKEEKKGNNKWELNRFATDITKHCVGVGGKLFKYFIKNYNPDYIKSFADRRWTLDKDINLYTKLGLKLSEILRPDYRYVNGLRREHKFGYRKHTLLRKYPNENLTIEMTEKEMCDKLGFYRIWDCGLFKFEWKK